MHQRHGPRSPNQLRPTMTIGNVSWGENSTPHSLIAGICAQLDMTMQMHYLSGVETANLLRSLL